MEELEKSCPQCSCTIWHGSGFRTADGRSAWRDVDGRWYDGPARDSMAHRCAHCGWTQTVIKERGKVVSVTKDPIKYAAQTPKAQAS